MAVRYRETEKSRTRPEVPPLGECPKDKGGAASGEEKAFILNFYYYQRQLWISENIYNRTS